VKYVYFQDIKIPAIALGTWSWGTGINGGNMIFGNDYQESDLKPVYDKAVESGFTLWDTAYIYAMGSSEKILGSFIKSNKDIIVSTKFTPFGIFDPPIEKAISKSCLDLNRNIIDIYFIHRPQNVKKWTSQLIPLMKSGKIKYAGVSNHNLAEIKEAKNILESAGLKLSCIQNHYSLIFRVSERNGILNFCKENRITFFSYMTLEQGALTDRYNSKNPFKPGSRRAGAFTPDILNKIEGLKNMLKQIGNKYDSDEAQIAMAWAIAKGTIPIIGVTKESHIEGALGALNITLEDRDVIALEKAAEETGVEIKGSWENIV